MLRHRFLGTAVVLFALTLLHSPPFACSEIIFEDDSSLTALDNSTATYNATTRDLHIKGSDSAIILTLAAYEPVLLLNLKLGNESKIRIVSAGVAKATCRWEITTIKSPEEADCIVKFSVGAKPTITFSTDEDNNSTNCNGTDFALLRVDMPPNTANITVNDMQLYEGNKSKVLERLEACTEIQPTSYPNQPIQNSSQQFSGVTYVWKIAVKKLPGNPFYMRLPESMTPVRLEPDPLTTTALTSSTTTPPTASEQTSPPSSNTAESNTVVIVCVTVGVVVLCLIVHAFAAMLRRRLLGTAVVLFALTLLRWPPFARSVVIFEDDSSLTALDNSTATYNATTRDLHIKGSDTFNLTLAAYEPVLSLDLKLDEESEIRIVSAEVAKATCRWGITTEKLLDDAVCIMTFAVAADLEITFSTKDGHNSTDCSSKNFTRLQVDLPPNTANITVEGMQLSSRGNELRKPKVLERLEACTELQPKPYPDQPIQDSSQQFPGVTYVWKMAVTHTLGKDFYIRLPDSMTPVRLEPDPPTTTTRAIGPTTSSNTAESNTVVIVCVTVGVVVLCLIVLAVVVCWLYRRRKKNRPSPQSSTPPTVPTVITNPSAYAAKFPETEDAPSAQDGGRFQKDVIMSSQAEKTLSASKNDKA